MKRLALAILLVTAVASAVFLALNRPGAEASPDFTITVDSTDDNNQRDDWMTLREAMKLATGELTLADLKRWECDQVSDTYWASFPLPAHCESMGKFEPGAASADTIVFDTSVFPPGSPATIELSCGILPTLDTGDDTVDGSGAGVIVEGEGTDEFDCFEISSDNNTIKGLEIYNCDRGIYLGLGANNTIGGSTQAERNVISGNESGVQINGDSTDGNTVKGNYIGTNAAGDTAIANNIGVWISGGAQNNTVGGTASGEGNTIAFNTYDNVRVLGSLTIGNTIRGNSIHSSDRKGIENMGGGNTGLEPPVIDSVGSVFGTALPNCIIDVYSDDDDEGRVYEGSTTADGDGNWSFSGTPEGPNITATATDSDGNTSEFSEPLTPPWPTPTSAPTPSPTPSPTPTPTPSPTPTASATPGTTRTVHWGPGWHSETWSGASTPEEAFACAAGNYAAVYKYVDGVFERYFPGQPDNSNLEELEQYDTFFILITDEVSCAMPVADAPGTQRTLDWGVGWHNEGWTGADGTAPEDAFECAEGSLAAAYRLVGGVFERYFPGQPDNSNMGPLNKYDAFLILVTAPVSCNMPIAP